MLTRSAVIEPCDIDIIGDQSQFETASDTDMPTAVAQLEEVMIRRALEACGGNRTEAARRLNISRQLLYTKMQRYGLSSGAASENPTQAVGKDDA